MAGTWSDMEEMYKKIEEENDDESRFQFGDNGTLPEPVKDLLKEEEAPLPVGPKG